MRAEIYQYSLIAAGIVATVLFGAFLSREIFPEYKIYQEDYISLERFRSSYTGESPPDFKTEVKQIVLEREDKGPPIIDRCTSCHVALQFPHFSPTKIAMNVNGNIERDAEGKPIQIPNENYVWLRLDEEIEKLTDQKKNQELEESGKGDQVSARLAQAKAYKDLKTAHVGDHVYDVTKVLQMHPLMGMETRPFEYHPISEFGCTSCHSGNGRGLTTEKAHGPIFDGDYEPEFMGPKPIFTEQDPDNDPLFARVFNNKPGHELLFQTTPILVNALIQAKCMNCHQDSASTLFGAANFAGNVVEKRGKISNAVQVAFDDEKNALAALLNLLIRIEQIGYEQSLNEVQSKSQDFTLPQKEQDQFNAQSQYLSKTSSSSEGAKRQIEQAITNILGSPQLTQALVNQAKEKGAADQTINMFLKEHQSDPGKGSIFVKMEKLQLEKEIMQHLRDTETSFQKVVNDQKVVSEMASEVDLLTKNYHRGEQLYISQACGACHRIAGFARGGVGPELTREGKSYPWFIKESIVWPQADLPTSTMPNYKMDHEDLEDLVTFLLAQTGDRKAISETAYKTTIQEWEAGKKLPWEKAIPAGKIKDLRYAMLVFATEGCSACHRLKGFESNVGFNIEKEKKGNLNFDDLYQEHEWFKNLFPETIIGSELVKTLDAHAAEIDQHITPDVRQGSIIEEIDQIVPGQVESLYTSFKYAARAKNHASQLKAAAAKDPQEKAQIEADLQQWKERVHNVLMMFIQEYGLGRVIGPRPNWSGVYRTDEWLMEHFHNPASHVPRSIMPVMPFDDTKFYALTNMLDVLGKHNRDEIKAIWEHRGFNPAQAFQIHCSQCHGEFMQGNGPVAEWIYPIPKNLRNTDFLRNLTKERVINSITHGVKGTPMPPWGEVAAHKPMMDNIPVLNQSEIKRLVDWMFSSLPGGNVIRGAQDVPKWNYTPEDVLKELEEEGNKLKSGKEEDLNPHSSLNSESLDLLRSLVPSGKGYYASLKPVPSPSNEEEENLKVSDVFDVVPNPNGPEKYAYYIKKKYFTQENIDQGDAFFQLNCSICHGHDADGTGLRASAMKDAKPRMLTNLDWSLTRDDLRLLRSIKYGVPGTAMTPWGDLTNSLQRLQLVIYIRSLTQELHLREELFSALYASYENGILTVENARIQLYPTLAKAQEMHKNLQAKRERLYDEINSQQGLSHESLEIYQQELNNLSELKKQQKLDSLLTNLKTEIASEQEIYQGIGLALLKLDDKKDFNDLLKLVKLKTMVYTFNDGKLNASLDPEKEKTLTELEKQIIDDLNGKITELEARKLIVEGKLASQDKINELTALNNQISSYLKIKKRVVTGFEDAVRSRQKQNQLLAEFNKEKGTP